MQNIAIKLEDNQMGFHPNRSTIDDMFIVRQIFEKSHEHNICITYLWIIHMCLTLFIEIS